MAIVIYDSTPLFAILHHVERQRSHAKAFIITRLALFVSTLLCSMKNEGDNVSV